MRKYNSLVHSVEELQLLIVSEALFAVQGALLQTEEMIMKIRKSLINKHRKKERER